MNHSRHHAREIALQILYSFDVQAQQNASPIPTGSELVSYLKSHFEHFVVPDGVREFASQLVVGTLSKSAEIDVEIEKYSSNWKIGRMALIDRNLIRMAFYEMSHFKDIPHSVSIDEAIELSKQFGTADTASFVNAILDSMRKQKLAG